jgi:hypothetical protein
VLVQALQLGQVLGKLNIKDQEFSRALTVGATNISAGPAALSSQVHQGFLNCLGGTGEREEPTADDACVALL